MARLLVFLATCVSLSKARTDLPVYDIDLDLPPEERFNFLVENKVFNETVCGLGNLCLFVLFICGTINTPDSNAQVWKFYNGINEIPLLMDLLVCYSAL